MLLSSSELSEAARGGSQTRDQQASGNINVLGNKTHLSNAAAVPTTQQQARDSSVTRPSEEMDTLWEIEYLFCEEG